MRASGYIQRCGLLVAQNRLSLEPIPSSSVRNTMYNSFGCEYGEVNPMNQPQWGFIIRATLMWDVPH